MKKPLVGLVMNYVKESQIFSNGLFQNIYTLCDMLQKEGSFEPIIYVGKVPENVDPNEAMITFSGLNIKVVQLKSVVDGNSQVPDLFIEVGSVIPEKWLKELYAKNPKLKVVVLHYGNVVIGHVESAVRGPEESPNNKRGCAVDYKSNRDIVWVSPHYAEHMQFYKWHYSAKIVAIAPYVWSSQYIDHTMKNSGVELSDEFGRIAVVEPNLNITKTAIVPIAIIDAAAQKSDSIKKGLTFCTEKWRKDPYHVKWVKDRYVYQNKKLTFNPRHRLSYIFAKSIQGKSANFNCGTLLSHHFHNGLNYVYLEALHLGIPLVHNSEFIKDAGYYYEGWNVMDGADMLIKAVEAGREGMTPEYKESAQQVLWRYSPDNFFNIKGYVDLIEEALNS